MKVLFLLLFIHHCISLEPNLVGPNSGGIFIANLNTVTVTDQHVSASGYLTGPATDGYYWLLSNSNSFRNYQIYRVDPSTYALTLYNSFNLGGGTRWSPGAFLDQCNVMYFLVGPSSGASYNLTRLDNYNVMSSVSLVTTNSFLGVNAFLYGLGMDYNTSNLLSFNGDASTSIIKLDLNTNTVSNFIPITGCADFEFQCGGVNDVFAIDQNTRILYNMVTSFDDFNVYITKINLAAGTGALFEVFNDMQSFDSAQVIYATAPNMCAITTTAIVTTNQDTTGRVTTNQDTTGRVTTNQDTTGRVTTNQDTTGEVTTNRFTTDVVTTNQDTTGEVTTNQDTTGRVTTNQDTTGRVTTNQFTTDVVTTNQFTTDVVTTNQDTTGRVTTNQDTTGRVTTNQDTTGEVTTNQDTTGRVTTNQDTTGRVTTNQDTTGQATTAQDTTGEITTSEVTTDDISSSTTHSITTALITTYLLTTSLVTTGYMHFNITSITTTEKILIIVLSTGIPTLFALIALCCMILFVCFQVFKRRDSADEFKLK